MGIIVPECLTTTPDGSTFYGLADTSSTDDTLSDFKQSGSFVIVKSNSNPTSPENLTWTVWSRISISDLPPMQLGGVPYGYRFDPNGKSGSNSYRSNNGQGAWTLVKYQNYNWPVKSDIQLLEYVNGPTGLQLLHCHMAEYTFSCATYDDATNSLVGALSWSFSTTNVPRIFAVGHERLYVLSRQGPLSSYPLFPITNSNNPIGTGLGTPPLCSNAKEIIISQKAMYLICGKAYYPLDTNDLLYVSSDPANNTTLPPAESVPTEMANFRAIRAIGSETGDGHFLLSVPSSGYTGLMALSLDGTSRTSHNLTAITVADTSGRILSDTKAINDPWSATVGAICGLVILGVLVAYLYKRRRNMVKAAKNAIQAETGPDSSADVDNKPAVTSGPSNSQATVPPVELSLTPAAQPVQSQPPTTILPMAPITSTPQQQQAVQNQMQELGFSSHPRPTVASVATGEPWKPTPFVPPASSQRIRAPETGPSTPTHETSTAAPTTPPPIPRGSRPSPEIEAELMQRATHHPHTIPN
ncbi:hypothetical protein EC991_007773 [Linnemannia zychae]|nr:hypothetical protein EC991_007773 [Linnemannia zychae]